MFVSLLWGPDCDTEWFACVQTTSCVMNIAKYTKYVRIMQSCTHSQSLYKCCPIFPPTSNDIVHVVAGRAEF